MNMTDPGRYDPFGEPDDMFMVAAAVYYRVEARGFEDGSPEDHWCDGETELRGQLERAEEGTESVPDSGAGPADIEREGE